MPIPTEAAATCPECPQHGANYPIALEPGIDRSGAAYLGCPNCGREWEAN